MFDALSMFLCPSMHATVQCILLSLSALITAEWEKMGL